MRKKVTKENTEKEKEVIHVNGRLMSKNGNLHKRWTKYFDECSKIQDVGQADVVAVGNNEVQERL